MTKTVEGDGNLQICVAIDPKQVSGLHAGRYVGDVVISGPGGTAVSVPIEATFRSSSKHAWIAAALGAAVGLILRVLSELAAGKRKKATRATLSAYFHHWSFWSMLVATPLLAAAGYYSVYADNTTWGSLQSDSWKLFITCLGFQLGGVGLIEILKKATGSTTATEAAGASA